LVFGLHIDPEHALREYFATYLKLGPAAKALEAFGVVEFATSIAPGLRDVLLTGKVYEATKPVRRGKLSRRYDAVVLDAPPTGRIKQFLTANSELAGLAKMGPIKHQAEHVMETLRTQSAVHLVSLLEEMSVQETVEAVAELREADLPVGTVIVNQARPRALDQKQLEVARSGNINATKLAASLASVGLGDRADLVDALVTIGGEHAERRELEDSQREVLLHTDTRSVELPKFASGVDLAALYAMASILRKGIRKGAVSK
jgi:anion-transporting  ArsA/GET3 family ATPase